MKVNYEHLINPADAALVAWLNSEEGKKIYVGHPKYGN